MDMHVPGSSADRSRSALTIKVLVGAATLLIIAAIGYSTYIADRNVRVLTPQVNAAHEIRMEIALAQLLAEELVHGDPDVKEADIWRNFRESDRLAQAMLEGGGVHGIILVPLPDEQLSAAITRLRGEIGGVLDLTGERLSRRKEVRSRFLLDPQLDAAFSELLSTAVSIESRLNELIRQKSAAFRAIQAFLIIFALSFSLAFLAALLRFDRSRAQNLIALEAVNLQLQASNQQLRAAEQQLRASNQQLMASEQQLQASNQQLLANEQAMQESERRFNSLFDGMAEGVALHTLVTDDAGRPVNYRIAEVNKRYENILGIPRDRVTGKLATEAYAAPEAPYLAEYAGVVKTGEPVRFTTYFPPLKKYFAISVAPFGPGMFATIFSDITEHRLAEDAVRRNEARLQAVLAVAQRDTESLQVFLDIALAQALGLLQSSIGYLYFYDERKKEFTLNSWSREVMQACRIQEPQTCYFLDRTGIWGEAVRQRQAVVVNDFTAEHPLRKGYPEGHVRLSRFLTIPVERHGVIVAVIGVANKPSDYDDADVKQLALFADAVWTMVERKQAEEARFLLESQMEKLESLGVLAGGIAHDFNNLLAAILGNVSLARSRISAEAKEAVWLGEAEKACNRAKDLTRQLLTFSRGGAPVKQASSIREIINDAAGFVLRGTSVAADLSFPEDIWAVDVDAGQMSQVFSNLLINAAQAMKDGGVVRIEGENRVMEDGALEPLKPGRYVVITVRDRGAGIPAEHLAKIFDPYFTTKEQGSGLGLAVTYSVVNRHSGHIAVQSAPDEGTVFTIFLPAAGERPREVKEPAPVTAAAGGRILVMDDERPVLNVVREMLQTIGYGVECAESGERALELYEAALRGGRRFDAVIVDLTVPGGMGGKELIKRLIEADPAASVIVSSGYSQDPIMADYRTYGFKGVLMKPYTVAALNEVLGRAIPRSE